MVEEQLFSASIGAFVGVMILLGVLSGLVALLTQLFPARDALAHKATRPTETRAAATSTATDPIDAATVAATVAAVESLLPGHRVTRLERTRG